MSVFTVERPVWRRYRPRFEHRAADFVRAGGHAALVDERGRVRVLLPVEKRGLTELGLWSLLAIEQRRWRRVKEGPSVGLATVRIKPAFVEAVLDWCARDAMHPGPKRTMVLDCIACAACCHDANVVLAEKDLTRFRDGGREELTEKAYIKRASDGVVTLRFAREGRCQLLAADKRCSIYSIRPDNCRAFVAGSEACMAAREETRGLRDGAPVGEQVELVEMGRRVSSRAKR